MSRADAAAGELLMSLRSDLADALAARSVAEVDASTARALAAASHAIAREATDIDTDAEEALSLTRRENDQLRHRIEALKADATAVPAGPYEYTKYVFPTQLYAVCPRTH